MNILITGASGQLGSDLIRVLAPGNELAALARRELDVTDRSRVLTAVREARPDVVIHAAAYTNVDGAEKDPHTAYAVNALGSRFVAEAAERVGAVLVYVSTDYVFDGRKGRSYTESDEPCPVNVYGRTKWEGERFVKELHKRSFIVRTSWLYGGIGRNFVNTVLALAARQTCLYAAEDAVGSPTYSPDLARFIAALIRTDHFGIYHAANQGSCSRYAFARAILEKSGMDPTRVVPVPSSHFVLNALRPMNSALDSAAIRRRDLPLLPDWLSSLGSFLSARFNKTIENEVRKT